MEREEQLTNSAVRAIWIDLEEPSVTLETADGPVAKLMFSSGTLYFQQPSESPSDRVILVENGEGGTPGPQEADVPVPGREKERPVVLSGRIKSRPREGRPDSQGRPTAWARLAVHEEGSELARVYSATFHRTAARIALDLQLDAAVTVEGYPHPSNDPEGKRLDTLSVFRFLPRLAEPDATPGS